MVGLGPGQFRVTLLCSRDRTGRDRCLFYHWSTLSALLVQFGLTSNGKHTSGSNKPQGWEEQRFEV